MNKQVIPPPVEASTKTPYFIQLIGIILNKPAAALVIVFLVFIGMITGYVPTKFDGDIEELKTGQVQLNTKVDKVQEQVKTAVDASTKAGESQEKLLRGICFILAQQDSNKAQQTTLLTYCNN